MNPKDKTKFQEALQLYDNKQYKASKRVCDKILEKSPTNEDTLALKGLVLLALKDKTEGEKLIKQALKLNIKSSTVWHFYALFYKELKNTTQALRCYIQAHKNDPTNFNVIRDISYIELFLRNFDKFAEYTRKTVDLKPNMLVNWTSYSFGLFLNDKPDLAMELIDVAMKMNSTMMKKQEIHEVVLYKALIMVKLNKDKECIKYLEDNIDKCVDKVLFYENIVKCAIKCKAYEKGLSYLEKLFNINSDNVNYIIWFFKCKLQLQSEINTYDDLLQMKEDSNDIEMLYQCLVNDIKPKLK